MYRVLRGFPNCPDDKYLVYRDGRIYSVWSEKFLKLKPSGDGYCQCLLGMKFTKAHIAVAHAFLGPRPEGKEVNHIDGNKSNNHFSNLEYVTHSENIKHSYDVLGRKGNTGKRRPHSKETKHKMALKKYKPVWAYSFKEQEEQTFSSVEELLEYYNIHRRSFNRWLIKPNKHFIFKFI